MASLERSKSRRYRKGSGKLKFCSLPVSTGFQFYNLTVVLVRGKPMLSPGVSEAPAEMFQSDSDDYDDSAAGTVTSRG